MRTSVPLFLLAFVFLTNAPVASGGPPASTELPQPLYGLLLRMDQFLHAGEVDGVTRDPRSLGNPAEEIRLSVVPQLLAYRELYRTYPSPVHYRDIVERADYLLRHINEAASGGATDGMLATALLAAWEVTGDGRYRMGAQPIIDRARDLSGFQARLNWGLMSAMALAEYSRLAGDPAAAAKAREIVQGVSLEQGADGSFPHYCPGTSDIHYSAWMSMELILIARSITDPVLQQTLSEVGDFLHQRVDPLGLTRYEETPMSGIQAYYYSLGSGCGIDYDTRGWINELGYLALLFAKRGDERFTPVLDRLRSLEDRGAFADKWDYFATLDDPVYLWAVAERSVIRTSVIFWSLASLYAEPTLMASATVAGGPPAMAAGGETELALVQTPTPAEGAAETATIEGVWPNPTRGECTISLRGAAQGETRIEIFDAAGRRVRMLEGSGGVAGRVFWDGRDDSGTRVGRGLYFVRAMGDDRTAYARVVVTH